MAQEFNMNIIVFLGPSLSLEEAKQILPNAYYLPPVRCGDILRTLRFKPKIIGIIDGYFEKTAAVWHKEILFAMENGVHVVGGSSMGALRASELIDFGMEAVGSIAHDYVSEIVNDDDEVAVLHGLKQSAYLPLTDAMVNIRDALTSALSENIIDKYNANIILNTAKQLFYQERTLDKAIENALALKNGIDKKQAENLILFLKKGDVKNIKKEDAMLVLKFIANKYFQNKNNKNNNENLKTNKPAFFRALQKNVSCRPFSHYEDWLPLEEKVALASRYLGPTYRLTRRLAYLLTDCYGLAVDENIQTNSDINTNSYEEKINILSELLKQESQRTDISTSPEGYLLILMRLSGDYKNRFLLKENDPLKFQVMSCFAQYWWLIERKFLRLGLNPTQQTLEEYSNNFRLTHKLYTPELTNQWLIDNDMNTQTYQYMVSANTRLSIFILQNNIDALRNFTRDKNIWWFLNALKLTGVYQAAQDLLQHPDKIKMLQEKAKIDNADLESYVRTLDFSGEQDFMHWPLISQTTCA